MTIRALEYLLLAVASVSVVLAVLIVADAFRDTVARSFNGNPAVIARAAVRSEAYRFITATAFLYVAVSFVSSPVPSPLPVGTGERVLLFTLGASFVLIASVDAYLTKRRLLRG